MKLWILWIKIQNSIPSIDIFKFLHLCGFTWRHFSPLKTTQVQNLKNINAMGTIFHFCIHFFQVNNNLHKLGTKKHQNIMMVNSGYKKAWAGKTTQVRTFLSLVWFYLIAAMHLCGFTWKQCTCVVLPEQHLCTCVVLHLIFEKCYTFFFENVLCLVSYFVRILTLVWIFHFSLSSKKHTKSLVWFYVETPDFKN